MALLEENGDGSGLVNWQAPFSESWGVESSESASSSSTEWISGNFLITNLHVWKPMFILRPSSHATQTTSREANAKKRNLLLSMGVFRARKKQTLTWQIFFCLKLNNLLSHGLGTILCWILWSILARDKLANKERTATFVALFSLNWQGAKPAQCPQAFVWRQNCRRAGKNFRTWASWIPGLLLA